MRDEGACFESTTTAYRLRASGGRAARIGTGAVARGFGLSIGRRYWSAAAIAWAVVAMCISGHADPHMFKRYNVRRDEVQADALARQTADLAQQLDATRRPAPVPRVGDAV